jgi:HK97 family phage major capsid protein
LGILNSPALITVGEEAGQSAASILYENVQKMWGRCWAPSRKNSVWLINQDAEPQLLGMRVHNAAATDFVGGPIYIAEGTAETAPYPALFGRPVIPVEHCSTVGTVGDIILADFTRYILATRAPSNVVSLHVNFVEDEALFRFVMRVDGQAIDATPITPLNGTDTKSPFVVLGTRA